MEHDRLADAAAIRALMTHYAHLIDDQRYDALAALFCRDAVWSAGDVRFAGREAIRSGFPQIEPPHPGMVKHLSYEPIIRFSGERARGWADAIALTVSADGIAVVATGRYHDSFAKEDGAWRFASRTFVYAGTPLPEGVAPSPDGPDA